MNKLLLILGGIFVVGGILFFSQKQKSPTSQTKVEEVKVIDSKSYLELFLKNIADKKIPEAIAMMTAKTVPDDAIKQAWGVQFAAFKKLVVKSIEPTLQESWTDNSEEYVVTLDVEMTPESANGPIPYYGYDMGINTRWVTMEKENGVWKVSGINTGP